MSVEFSKWPKELRAAHLAAGHDMMGPPHEQTDRDGTRYTVAYCECGWEFIEYPTLREAKK